ncbi:MAG TPA: tRNA (N(6)-L-threonylcarbamoyladenosine(37)-C(2))-methylthiotransferase MtaB, partial [Clostridia bacterium]
RSDRLIELSNRCQLEFNRNFLGRVMPVLYEQEDNDMKGWYEGLTPNYIRVLSKGDPGISGNILPTRLLEAENDFILGEI